MRVRRIVLENFVSHAKSTIDLDTGVTLIVGPNGAGKTSIIDALALVLFEMNTRTKTKSLANLIKHGAGRARVEVEFSAGSRNYVVVKVLKKRDPSETYLYRVENHGRVLVARGATSVAHELQQVIAAPIKMLGKIVISPQGELEAILSSKSRKEYLESILGLEALKKTYEKMREIIREVEKELKIEEHKKSLVRAQLESLQESKIKLETLRKELAKLTAKLDAIDRELSSLETRRKELEEKHLELLDLEKEYIEKSTRLKTLEEQLENYRRQLDELIESIEYYNRLKQVFENIDLIEEYAKLADQYKELSKKLYEREKNLTLSLKQIKIDLESFTADSLEEKLGEIEERVKELREKRDSLLKLVNMYEAVKRELEYTKAEHSRIIEEIEYISRKHKDTLREVFKPLGEIKLENPLQIYSFLADYKRELEEELANTRRRIEEANRKLGAISQKKKEVEERIDKLASVKGKCPLCGQDLTESHRIKLIKTLRVERQRLEEDLKRALNTFNELKKEEERLQIQLSKIIKSIEELGELKGKYESLIKRRKELEKKISNLESNLMELLPYAQEYRMLEEELGNLELLRDKLINIKMKYIELYQLKDQISEIESLLERRLQELLNKGVAASKAGLEKLVERLPELREEKKDLEIKMAKYQEIKTLIPRLEQEYSTVLSSLTSIRQEIKVLERLRSEIKIIESEIERARKEREQILREIGVARGRIKELEEQVAKIEEVRKEAEKIARRVDGLQKLLRDLERIRSIVHETLPKLVRQRARALIEYYLRSILRSFNMDFVDIKLDDDFEITVYGRSGERSLSMLSGGERVAVAIAFRLALAAIMAPKIGMLILDEPTSFLDEENRRELVRVIKSGISDIRNLEQLIIVSHERELEEAADQVIEVYRDNSGVSRVIKRTPSASLRDISVT